MDLFTYISDMQRRITLAEACGTSPQWLWQIATRWNGKRASADLAESIEKETARLGLGVVTKESVIFGPPPAPDHPADQPAEQPEPGDGEQPEKQEAA